MSSHASRVGLLALVVGAGLAGASDAHAGPPVGVLELLTGFSAKEVCSCVFVVEQTDAYCKAFGQQPGFDVALAIDHAAQTVTATVASTARTARVVPGGGCALDAL